MPIPSKERAKIEKARTEVWAEYRRDFKVEDLEIRSRNGVTPGVHAIEAYDRDHPCPVGQLWWRWGLGIDDVEILNSYTFPDVRRLGVRTRLQNYLIEWLKPRVVVTGRESTPDGIAWMEKFGYRLDRKRGVWSYLVSKRKRS